MRSRIVNVGGPVRRLYVSRRANPTRPLVEEDRIEQIFVSLGFHVFHPESHDIHDQIAIFANAELIAGCSGSSLFNLAFQARARAVLVMASPLLVHYSEQILSTHHHAVSFEIIVGYVADQDNHATPGWVHTRWHLEPSLVQDFAIQWVRDNQ